MQLEGIFEALQSKAGAVKAALESEEEAAHGSLFDTTEERYNQHAVNLSLDTDDASSERAQYTLRAVLMHDGALIAGKHLYAYVVDDVGAWWKVEEHECSRVSHIMLHSGRFCTSSTTFTKAQYFRSNGMQS